MFNTNIIHRNGKYGWHFSLPLTVHVFLSCLSACHSFKATVNFQLKPQPIPGSNTVGSLTYSKPTLYFTLLNSCTEGLLVS